MNLEWLIRCNPVKRAYYIIKHECQIRASAKIICAICLSTLKVCVDEFQQVSLTSIHSTYMWITVKWRRPGIFLKVCNGAFRNVIILSMGLKIMPGGSDRGHKKMLRTVYIYIFSILFWISTYELMNISTTYNLQNIKFIIFSRTIHAFKCFGGWY